MVEPLFLLLLPLLFSVFFAHASNVDVTRGISWIDAKDLPPVRSLSFKSPSLKLESILSGRPARSIVPDQPVYVSITTISSRIAEVDRTISHLLTGTVIPDHIYLFISQDPYLLDKGIQRDEIPPRLMLMTYNFNFSIIFTENIGPHRKLIPLLSRKWTEDCIIITLDDEDKFGLEKYVMNLLMYYLASNRTAVVSLKARRLALCESAPHRIAPYNRWGDAKWGLMEFFLLPTGTGGVLYRPRFMHPVVFDPRLRNLTATADDLMFRLSTMANNVQVVTGCRETYVTMPVYTTANDTALSTATAGNQTNSTTNSAAAAPPNRQLSRGGGRRVLSYCPPQPLIYAINGGNYSEAMAARYREQTEEVDLKFDILEEDDDDKDGEVDQDKDKSKMELSDKKDLASAASSSVSDPRQPPHRRLTPSLFANYNYKRGNDNAWTGAVTYLKTSRVLDLTQAAVKYLRAERTDCFNRPEARRGKDYSGSNCMLERCKRKPKVSTSAL